MTHLLRVPYMNLLYLNKKHEIQQSGLLNTTLASNFYSVDVLVVIIDWDNVVLDQENDLCGRKVKEGIQIRLTNKKRRRKRDEERDLSPEWFAIIKKILHGRLQQSYDTLRIAS